MKTKEEIKQVLKQMQVSFNPMKSTYRIIDKIVKNDLSSEEMLSYFSDIKGTEKYPKELKDQYDDVKQSLNNLIIMEREAKEKAKQEETTKELKEIIDKLEAHAGKKEDDESSLEDLDKTEVIDLDFDEKETKNKDDNKENSNKSLEKKPENEIVKTAVKKEPKESKEDKSKGKKLFVFLIIMIFVLLVCGALILLFY